MFLTTQQFNSNSFDATSSSFSPSSSIESISSTNSSQQIITNSTPSSPNRSNTTPSTTSSPPTITKTTVSSYSLPSSNSGRERNLNKYILDQIQPKSPKAIYNNNGNMIVNSNSAEHFNRLNLSSDLLLPNTQHSAGNTSPSLSPRNYPGGAIQSQLLRAKEQEVRTLHTENQKISKDFEDLSSTYHKFVADASEKLEEINSMMSSHRYKDIHSDLVVHEKVSPRKELLIESLDNLKRKIFNRDQELRIMESKVRQLEKEREEQQRTNLFQMNQLKKHLEIIATRFIDKVDFLLQSESKIHDLEARIEQCISNVNRIAKQAKNTSQKWNEKMLIDQKIESMKKLTQVVEEYQKITSLVQTMQQVMTLEQKPNKATTGVTSIDPMVLGFKQACDTTLHQMEHLLPPPKQQKKIIQYNKSSISHILLPVAYLILCQLIAFFMYLCSTKWLQ